MSKRKTKILHTAHGDLEIKVYEGPQSCCAFSEPEENTLEYYQLENSRLKLEIDILKQRLEDAMLRQEYYKEQVDFLMSKLNSN